MDLFSMHLFKYKIKLPVFITQFLLIICACSSCTAPVSTIDENEEIIFQESNIPHVYTPEKEESAVQEYKNPRIYLLDDDIKINDQFTYRGQKLDLEPGVIEIIFHGEILLPVSTKSADSDVQDTAEVIDFFACLTFLPICALTRPNIFTKSTVKNVVRSTCSGKRNIYLHPDTEYSIGVIKNVDSVPLLTVMQTTKPSYNILEQELTCTDT